ncbi:MAG: hypothetical protein JRJ26_15985 [Deltaproteobacteria bacterium]|nr:hypothetical protein [Deltaproteobacteria bacterium]
MKKGVILGIVLAVLWFPLVSWTSVELTATWNPNSEPDISHYNLYMVYQGEYERINDEPIRHPDTSYTFALDLPDGYDEPLCFVVTAVDRSGNESDYSEPVCVD